MYYRRFGKTDLQMPVISFGCMRSMHSWTDLPLTQIPNNSHVNLEDLARTALAHGINHFETAHGYGSSERQLGTVLPKLNRKDLILQTKVVPHQDPEVFIRNFHESLNRLQVDHVDLLAIHGINDYRSLWESCRKGGCLAAARKLQQQGKALHIGFSGHGPLDVILEAINHQEDGGFDFVNIHWYYIYNINLPAIEQATERDLGVYIISPTDKGGMLYSPPPAFKTCCAPLSPILFNDVYCLSQPGVTSISVGASRISDFDEHLKALEMDLSTQPQKIQNIAHALETLMQSRTGHRRPEGIWNELPTWEMSPGNINLRFIHWLGNLARGWDLDTFSRARYDMLGAGSSWVPGNNAATLDMTVFDEMSKKYPAFTESFLGELRDTHIALKKKV